MKRFTLEIEVTEDNKLSVKSECDGFSPFELIGVLAWKQKDIENQLFGNVKPDVVSRKFIKE